MSIQSEIARINQAKADILSALTEKGVDVTGAGLADIAALVVGIEAGGGSVVTGTVVANGYDVKIEGAIPTADVPVMYLAYEQDFSAGSNTYPYTLFLATYGYKAGEEYSGGIVARDSGKTSLSCAHITAMESDIIHPKKTSASDPRIGINSTSGTLYLGNTLPGVTYRYLFAY